ncbi:MAG: hypothetical protein EBQ95_08315 [Gammaproteobacteria bacterium]|nr:hypothetical protein [Gammaproteobacteria bacterium]
MTFLNCYNILLKSGFDQDLGILSIDIDGNDYYIFEAINFYKPRIIICEYNSVFGPDRKISIPYKEDFYRTSAHYSNLYWGASLSAFVHLAENKGYAFVGTNSTGLNAFFVRQDLVNDKLNVLTANDVHFVAKFRDALNIDGQQIFPTQQEKHEIIKGLPVINIENNVEEFL